MKILIVIDYFEPQLGYSENFFSKEFIKLGHEVWVLTSNYYFPFPNYKQTMQSALGDRILKPGVVWDKGIKIIRKKLIFEIFARAFFGGHDEIIKQFNPDIVIVNKSAGFSAVLIALLKKKYSFKLFCYDSLLPSELNRGNKWLKEAVYYLFRICFSDALNSSVDKFIAVQEQTKDVMVKYFGIKKHIDIIPLGTDIESFRFGNKERLALRKNYQIQEKDFAILYTGKLIEAKGVDLLFNAFNKLASNIQNIKMLVVGDGTDNYKKSCLKLVAEKYQKNVIFIPFQPKEQLYKYYSAADVAVWPLQESTSMNDAAACELPFIANDELGDKTRISYNNALLYRKGDTTDLYKKIQYLYNDQSLRKKMGKNGRKLAEEKLSWREIAKE